MAFVQNHIGKDLADDPVYQEKLKAGLIAPPKSEKSSNEPMPELPKGAALSAYLFLAGVVLVVLTAFPAFQQMVPGRGDGEMVAVSATTIIQIIMFVVALLIVIFTKIKPGDIPKQRSSAPASSRCSRCSVSRGSPTPSSRSTTTRSSRC